MQSTLKPSPQPTQQTTTISSRKAGSVRMGGGGEAHQIKINSLLLVVELNKLFKSSVIKFAQNEPQNATLTVLSLENGQVWNFDQRNFTINFQKTQRKIQLNLPSGFPLGKAIFRFDFGPHYLENNLKSFQALPNFIRTKNTTTLYQLKERTT